jgi:hypothetical protein
MRLHFFQNSFLFLFFYANLHYLSFTDLMSDGNEPSWAQRVQDGELIINSENVKRHEDYDSLLRFLMEDISLVVLKFQGFQGSKPIEAWNWRTIFQSLLIHHNLSSLGIIDCHLDANDILELSNLLFWSSPRFDIKTMQNFPQLHCFASDALLEHGINLDMIRNIELLFSAEWKAYVDKLEMKHPSGLPSHYPSSTTSRLQLNELCLFGTWISDSLDKEKEAFPAFILSLLYHHSITILNLHHNILHCQTVLDIISILKFNNNPGVALSIGQNMLLGPSERVISAATPSSSTKQPITTLLSPFWNATPFDWPIRSLSLSGTNLTTDCLLSLLGQLKRSNSIRRLDLSFNPFDINASGVQEAFSELSCLAILSISYLTISDKSKLAWLCNDTIMISLEELWMKGCTISSKTLSSLASTLANNHSLKKLSLEGTMVDAKALGDICYALCMNKTLQTLHLADSLTFSKELDPKMNILYPIHFMLQNNFTIVEMSIFTQSYLSTFLPLTSIDSEMVNWFSTTLCDHFLKPILANNSTIELLFGQTVISHWQNLVMQPLVQEKYPNLAILVHSRLDTLSSRNLTHQRLANGRREGKKSTKRYEIVQHNNMTMNPESTMYFFHPPFFELNTPNVSTPSSPNTSRRNSVQPGFLNPGHQQSNGYIPPANSSSSIVDGKDSIDVSFFDPSSMMTSTLSRKTSNRNGLMEGHLQQSKTPFGSIKMRNNGTPFGSIRSSYAGGIGGGIGGGTLRNRFDENSFTHWSSSSSTSQRSSTLVVTDHSPHAFNFLPSPLPSPIPSPRTLEDIAEDSNGNMTHHQDHQDHHQNMTISFNFELAVFPCLASSIKGKNIVRFSFVGLGMPKIPDNILSVCPNIQCLDFRGNKIERIQAEIGQLKELISLHLAHNLLDSIHWCLLDLPKLQLLSLHRNPLRLVPHNVKQEMMQPMSSVKWKGGGLKLVVHLKQLKNAFFGVGSTSVATNSSLMTSNTSHIVTQSVKMTTSATSSTKGQTIGNHNTSIPMNTSSIALPMPSFHCRMMVFGGSEPANTRSVLIEGLRHVNNLSLFPNGPPPASEAAKDAKKSKSRSNSTKEKNQAQSEKNDSDASTTSKANPESLKLKLSYFQTHHRSSMMVSTSTKPSKGKKGGLDAVTSSSPSTANIGGMNSSNNQIGKERSKSQLPATTSLGLGLPLIGMNSPHAHFLATDVTVNWMCYDFPAGIESAAALFIAPDMVFVNVINMSHWNKETLEEWVEMISHSVSIDPSCSMQPFIYVVGVATSDRTDFERESSNMVKALKDIFPAKQQDRIGWFFVDSRTNERKIETLWKMSADLTQRAIATGMCIKQWPSSLNFVSSLIRDLAHTPTPQYSSTLTSTDSLPPYNIINASSSNTKSKSKEKNQTEHTRHRKQNLISLSAISSLIYHAGFKNDQITSTVKSLAENGSILFFGRDRSGASLLSNNDDDENDDSNNSTSSLDSSSTQPESLLSNLVLINLDYCCQLFSRLASMQDFARNTQSSTLFCNGLVNLKEAQRWWDEERFDPPSNDDFIPTKRKESSSSSSKNQSVTSLSPSSSKKQTIPENSVSVDSEEVDMPTFWAILAVTGLAIRLQASTLKEAVDNNLTSTSKPSLSPRLRLQPSFRSSNRDSSSSIVLRLSAMLDEDSKAELDHQMRKNRLSTHSSASYGGGGVIVDPDDYHNIVKTKTLNEEVDGQGNSTNSRFSIRQPVAPLPTLLEDSIDWSDISSPDVSSSRRTSMASMGANGRTLANSQKSPVPPLNLNQRVSSSLNYSIIPSPSSSIEEEEEWYFVPWLLPQRQPNTWHGLEKRLHADNTIAPLHATSTNNPRNAGLAPPNPLFSKLVTSSAPAAMNPSSRDLARLRYYQRLYSFKRIPFGLFEHLVTAVMALPGCVITNPYVNGFEVHLGVEIGQITFILGRKLMFVEVAGDEKGTLLAALEPTIQHILEGWYDMGHIECDRWIGYRVDQKTTYYENVNVILTHLKSLSSSPSSPSSPSSSSSSLSLSSPNDIKIEFHPMSLNSIINLVKPTHDPPHESHSQQLQQQQSKPNNTSTSIVVGETSILVPLSHIIPDHLMKWAEHRMIDPSDLQTIPGSGVLGAGGFGLVYPAFFGGHDPDHLVAVKRFKASNNHLGIVEKQRMKLQKHHVGVDKDPISIEEEESDEDPDDIPGQLKALQELQQEVRILSILGDHPYIVKMIGWMFSPPQVLFENLSGGKLKICSPHILSGVIEASLTPWHRAKMVLTPISDASSSSDPTGEIKDFTFALRALLDIAKAMEFCHFKDILHRDLFILNVLRTHSNDPFDFRTAFAKLIDFGMARMTLNQSGETGQFKNERFMLIPPETRQNRIFQRAGDVFAFATLLYQLYTQQFGLGVSEHDMFNADPPKRSPLPKLAEWSLTPNNCDYHAIADGAAKTLEQYYIAPTNFAGNGGGKGNTKSPPTLQPSSARFYQLKAMELYQDLLKSCWEHFPTHRPTFSTIVMKLNVIFALWTRIAPPHHNPLPSRTLPPKPNTTSKNTSNSKPKDPKLLKR